MARPTSLETARLSLRRVDEADRNDLIALERDAEVMRFINGGSEMGDVEYEITRDMWRGAAGYSESG